MWGVPWSVISWILLLLLNCASTLALGGGSSHPSSLKLVLMPFLGDNSPALDLMGVGAHLGARGHEVLVAVMAAGHGYAKRAAARHSSNSTAEALHYLVLSQQEQQHEQQQRATDPSTSGSRLAAAAPAEAGHSRSQLKHPGRYSSLLMLVHIQQMLAEPCAALLADSEAMQRLQDFQPDAVLGISVPMHSDSCGCVLSHHLGVPFIDVSGHPIVDAPPSIPQFGSGLTPEDLATPWGWAQNLWAWNMRQLLPTLLMDFHSSNPWPQLRRRLGLPPAASSCPLTNSLARLRGQGPLSCSSLVEVILGSWLLEYPQQLSAHQKMVGPGSPRPAQPLQPPDVASFVGGALKHGLVLAAFGTMCPKYNQRILLLSQTDLVELAQGFAALAPVRVLWALPRDGMPPGLQLSDLPLNSNTKAVPWVDYNDVLGHPATKAFVSHCGLHSVYEASFHGIPVIGMPFHFEQAEHAARLAHRGVGVVSPEAPAYRDGPTSPQHFTRGSIEALVREVMSNASYHKAAQGISAALRAYAAARHPYARAADEVELALLAAQARAADTAPVGQPQNGHNPNAKGPASIRNAAPSQVAAEVVSVTGPRSSSDGSNNGGSGGGSNYGSGGGGSNADGRNGGSASDSSEGWNLSPTADDRLEEERPHSRQEL